MSARGARSIRRAVAREIRKREPALDALFAAKLKPRPWWVPGCCWRWLLRRVLKDPPAASDFSLINSALHLLRGARARLARRVAPTER